MKVFVVFALVAVVSHVIGKPQGLTQQAPEPYNYHYKIENSPTKTFFGHSENGDPTGKVFGNYYVLLADGRLMSVEYLVNGESGFVPKISFQTNANPFQG